MARFRPRIALALALGSLASGCETYDGPPVFELGTGEDEFEPVEDGATLRLASGSQGGRHVWVAGRVLGTEDEITLVYEIVDAETGEPVVAKTRRQVDLDDDANDEFSGITAQVPDPYEFGPSEPAPPDPVGREHLLRATVEDRAGVELSDELRFVLAR